jgi:PAS domain S-box-containing protein
MQGHILDFNQALKDMLGYIDEELKKSTYLQITPEKWHEMEANIVKDQVVRKGYSGEYEKEYIRKDGTVFPISIRVWLIKDEKGTPIGMWGIIRDITERKRAEEGLRESEEKYRELVQNANSIILKADMSGNVIFFNEFAQRFFGYAEDEIVGKNLVGTIVPKTDAAGRDLEAMIHDIVVHHDNYVSNENENVCRDGARV